MWLGEPWIVNPLLGAILLAVVYRWGSELLGSCWALLATLYVWGMFKLRDSPRPLGLSALAGLALGLTFLVRPFTAVCLLVAGIPLATPSRQALARYGPLLFVFTLTSALLPLHNYLLGGDFRLSLYTEWWAYDHLGFGPAIGPRGYHLSDALTNLWLGLAALNHDLHGWLFLSLAFLLPHKFGYNPQPCHGAAGVG